MFYSESSQIYYFSLYYPSLFEFFANYFFNVDITIECIWQWTIWQSSQIFRYIIVSEDIEKVLSKFESVKIYWLSMNFHWFK